MWWGLSSQSVLLCLLWFCFYKIGLHTASALLFLVFLLKTELVLPAEPSAELSAASPPVSFPPPLLGGPGIPVFPEWSVLQTPGCLVVSDKL